jgi:lipoate-protein ligase B
MAAIDRVVHHSVILDMMGVESYRAKAAHQQHLHQQEQAQTESEEVLTESEKIVVATGKNYGSSTVPLPYAIPLIQARFFCKGYCT